MKIKKRKSLLEQSREANRIIAAKKKADSDKVLAQKAATTAETNKLNAEKELEKIKKQEELAEEKRLKDKLKYEKGVAKGVIKDTNELQAGLHSYREYLRPSEKKKIQKAIDSVDAALDSGDIDKIKDTKTLLDDTHKYIDDKKGSISYQRAHKIKKIGLVDLIMTHQQAGKGLRQSIRDSISDKTKANIKTFRAKFDSLNIAKALGGRLGVSILGKLTDRSHADISHFGGMRLNVSPKIFKKRHLPNFGKQPTYTTPRSRYSTKSTGLLGPLNRIYEIIAENIESEKKRKELDADEAQQKEEQKEKWHKEILEALSGKFATTTKTKTDSPEANTGGIFGWLIDAFNKFKELLLPVTSFLEVLGSKALRALTVFGSFLTNPFVLGILGTGALVLGLVKLLELVNDKTPNAKALSPKEAANLLATGNDVDIDKAGGEEKLRQLISEGPRLAQETLDSGDVEKIKAAGGEEKLRQIIAEGEIAQPTRGESNHVKKLGFTKKEFLKQGKLEGQQLKWERNFAPYYTDEGVLKPQSKTATIVPKVQDVISDVSSKATIVPKENNTDAVTQKTVNPEPVEPANSPKLKPIASLDTSTQKTPVNVSKRVTDAIAENNDVQLNAKRTETVVINQPKTVSVQNKSASPSVEIESSAPVRIDDLTLIRIQKQNLRRV